MKNAILAATLAAIALPAAPALADPPSWAPAHGRRDHDRERERDRYEDYRNDHRGDYRQTYRQTYNGNRYYDRAQRRYYREQRLSYNDRVWGNNGRYYCRRSDGTTGTIVGAGLGALAGSAMAGRRDQTLGVILGGVTGGLLGRSIDRGDLRCR